jgi:lanosterol synthase
MFALESLSVVGETYSNSESVRKACHFLLERQKEDGGWGENWKVSRDGKPTTQKKKKNHPTDALSAPKKSCETSVYVQHERSQVVGTAWAVLGLLRAQAPQHDAIRRGVKLIMSRQKKDGSWDQEAIEGIFNKVCGSANCSLDTSWDVLR